MTKIKKTIGILNRGRCNSYFRNTFSGMDIGIQDEGEHTFAAGNEFEKGSNIRRWWEKTWVQTVMFLGAVAGIIGLLFMSKN